MKDDPQILPGLDLPWARTKATPAQVNQKLDRVELTAHAMHGKDCESMKAQLQIFLNTQPDKTGYIDEFLLAAFSLKARNFVGPAVRSLLRSKVIQKTGRHKKSQRRESNGREIWEYRLIA